MKRSVYFLMIVFLSYHLGVAQQVGAPAPDFTHSTVVHGTISLSDFQGKVVYLFFFGWA